MRLFSATLLTFLVGAMFLSLFNLSIGATMSGEMSDCPFMTLEEVVCTMNVDAHMSAWKASFLAAGPTIIVLLTIAGALAFLITKAPNLLSWHRRVISTRHKQLRERTYTFFFRPFQELFAQGILHPKVF